MKQLNGSKISKYLVLTLLVVGITRAGLDLKTYPILNVDINFNEFENVTESTNDSVFPKFADDGDFYLYIDSDDDFEALGFPGNGSKDYPYIIENLTISTDKTFGIHIVETTAYFVIRNCFIDAAVYGIYFALIAPNTARVESNTFYRNVIGFELHNCENTTIVSNNFTKNADDGILLWDSPYSIITNNSFVNNGRGLDSTGLVVTHSEGSLIANNEFIKDGISIVPDIKNELQYIVENNTANGKLIGYFDSVEDLAITEDIYGQLILSECTNVRISNQVIADTDVGINIYYSTDVLITNNSIFTSDRGIHVFQSSNVSIVNNLCNFNLGPAIQIEYKVENIEITDNICNNNEHGIIVSISDFRDNKGIIKDNVVNNNLFDGIDLFNVIFADVTNNTVKNNTKGIILYETHESNFTLNWIEDNSDYGFQIKESYYQESSPHNNRIHHNNFLGNSYILKKAQAYDGGYDNLWYDEELKQGNYWSDWLGSGSYALDGQADAEDPYPLSKIALSIPERKESNLSYLWLLLIVPIIIAPVFFWKKNKRNKNDNQTPPKKQRVTSEEGKEKTKNQKRSIQQSLNSAIIKNLRMSLAKGVIIGAAIALALGSIVPIYLHFKNVTPNLQDNNSNTEFPANFAEAIQQSIPDVVHLEIIGNGTTVIHERLLEAKIDRINSTPDLSWEVTAQVINYDEYGRIIVSEIVFILNDSEIAEISQSLFDSLNSTERLGTYGEKPYNTQEIYDTNLKWAMRLFLENHTLIDLIILENGLIIADVGSWTTFEEFDSNMIGAAVLGPESAFDYLIGTLKAIFSSQIEQ
ncbi:MAG: NosD domain-containing protein [Candidatus Heimdallarchaeaceae archaeon]